MQEQLEAIRLDDKYAEPHIALAHIYNQLGRKDARPGRGQDLSSFAPRRKRSAQAVKSVRQAIGKTKSHPGENHEAPPDGCFVANAVTSLKLEASHELDGAWSGDRPVPGTEGVARGRNVGDKGISGTTVGIALVKEVVAIESVEEVGLEPEVQPLRDVGILDEPYIQVPIAGSVDRLVLPSRSQCSQRRRSRVQTRWG